MKTNRRMCPVRPEGGGYESDKSQTEPESAVDLFNLERRSEPNLCCGNAPRRSELGIAVANVRPVTQAGLDPLARVAAQARRFSVTAHLLAW